MRQTTEIFIPIPKVRNTHCKVEIKGDDQTRRIISSKFIYPTTSGIGTFSLVLSNANGQLNGLYKAGNIVKFYADNLDNTTLQFWGRIDYVKGNISQEGQLLEIEGRHRSFLLTEHLVCHLATNTSPAQILKDIIDKLPSSYGFTYVNINSDTVVMDVEWNYKPFWDCVFELCKYSGFDCYIDNDLDFHYFEANSIANESDAIVEGDNFIKIKDWGTNDTYEKTRVIVIGQDSGGFPIIYTAVSPNEGDEIREVFIKDTSANTVTKVKNIAEAKLEEMTNRNPQARILSYGLETIKPGENIWLMIPREQIFGQYKIIQITHKFGSKIGGWRTECLIEEEETGTSQIIKKVDQQIKRGIKSDNKYKMDYSYNWDFTSDTGTHSGTSIQFEYDSEGEPTNGFLSGVGSWTSELIEMSSAPTAVEVRVDGTFLNYVKIWYSGDGGTTFSQIWGTGVGESGFTIPSGEDVKLRVDISSADTEINALVILYKIN